MLEYFVDLISNFNLALRVKGVNIEFIFMYLEKFLFGCILFCFGFFFLRLYWLSWLYLHACFVGVFICFSYFICCLILKPLWEIMYPFSHRKYSNNENYCKCLYTVLLIYLKLTGISRSTVLKLQQYDTQLFNL